MHGAQNDPLPLKLRALPDFGIQALMPFAHMQSFVVAVSGGPDSQVLLDLMGRAAKALGWKLIAVGIDHGLRPEAGLELDLAEALAQRHQIDFKRIAVAVSPQGNISANARTARYQALRKQAQIFDADAIALAHTASDQLETIVWRLLRGCSMEALAGIYPHRDGLVRPLLQVTRAQIIAYLQSRSIAAAQDPSNHSHRYTRAQLRHRLIPILEDLAPGCTARVARNATQRQHHVQWAQSQAQQALQTSLCWAGRGIQLAKWKGLPETLKIEVLRLWCRSHGQEIGEAHVHNILKLAAFERSAQRLHAPMPATSIGQDQIVWHQDALGWLPAKPKREARNRWAYPLNLAGITSIDEISLEIRADNKPPHTTSDVAEKLSDLAVVLDRSELQGELIVRPWQPGDRLALPPPHSGHSKVSDLLTNAKISRVLRWDWPVLVANNKKNPKMPATARDQVLWVPGLRACGVRKRTMPATTKTTQHAAHVYLYLHLHGAFTTRMIR